MSYSFDPVGIVHSCYPEKFGIPRQPGLVPEATATLALLPPYNSPAAVNGLATFSHLWLIFVFHASQQTKWKATVRPPRLGGNQRLGVFATRSMFRPNSLGLSAVELTSINHQAGQTVLHLKGIDLLDGTPVLDIKPYLPYADALATATGGFATEAPTPLLAVNFTPTALAQCETLAATRYQNLQALISQTLQLDPRPAYYAQRPQKTVFGMRLYDLDVKWTVKGKTVWVLEIDEV